jgi:hypothetical protein
MNVLVVAPPLLGDPATFHDKGLTAVISKTYSIGDFDCLMAIDMKLSEAEMAFPFARIVTMVADHYERPQDFAKALGHTMKRFVDSIYEPESLFCVLCLDDAQVMEVAPLVCNSVNVFYTPLIEAKPDDTRVFRKIPLTVGNNFGEIYFASMMKRYLTQLIAYDRAHGTP